MIIKLLLLLLTLIIISQVSLHQIVPGDQITPEDKHNIQNLETFLHDINCDYYMKFKKIFNYCSVDDYIIAFGYKYCELFKENRDKFIDTKWLDSVKQCLQKELQQHIMQIEEYPKCAKIEDWGFISHQICYLKPIPEESAVSWCNLSLIDQLRVIWISRDSYLELIIQGIPIIYTCYKKDNQSFTSLLQ